MQTKVKFSGQSMKLGVAEDMLGRVFDGSGKVIDKGPKVLPEDYIDINGSAINPFSRVCGCGCQVETRVSDRPLGISRGNDINWYFRY